MSERPRNAPPPYLHLLDGDALAKIHRLELIARGVVEGFIAGRHRSPYKGFSVEFAEHRQYVPGDDTRDLDWRVYGKSDRYYVKQYIEETNLRATILLDASGSMRYTGTRAAPGHDGRPLSKFEYGQFLAACLAHLLIHQQDAVGLVTYDTAIRRYIPARSRTSHFRWILQELAATEPGGESDMGPILDDIAERAHRRGLIVVISDLFDDPEALLKAMHHFRHRRHEVIMLHVMAEEELTFPFEEALQFRDLEVPDNRVQFDPRAIRADYLDRIRDHVAQLKKGCGQLHIDYVPISTSRSFELALAQYLSARLRRA